MHVLLLKTRSSPTDNYEEYFTDPANGAFTPHFVPVLEHKFNQSALQHVRSLILTGAFKSSTNTTAKSAETHNYGAIIFTSQRAVEAFSCVVQQLRDESHHLDDLLPASLPLYVVGPATARGLAALRLDCKIEGEESGNGDMLAKFILARYDVRSSVADNIPGQIMAPVLFLVGEQRRDIIPRTLQSEELPDDRRIPVDEVAVYETGVMESFPGDFEKVVKSCDEPEEICIVVFSPTGCAAMLEGIGMIDPVTGKIKDDATDDPGRARIATIGPTTRDYLKKQFDFDPDICAEKPSPEGIGEGIRHYMLNIR